MFVNYPVVDDSCVWILFLECTCNLKGGGGGRGLIWVKQEFQAFMVSSIQGFMCTWLSCKKKIQDHSYGIFVNDRNKCQYFDYMDFMEWDLSKCDDIRRILFILTLCLWLVCDLGSNQLMWL